MKGRQAPAHAPDSPPKESSRKRKSAGANATQGASQQTIDEAAEDAQAEQEMMDSEQSAGDSRSPAGGGGGAPKAGKRPDGLLERRLTQAREEKGMLAARVAQLEARLNDAEAAAQTAQSPKVMHTFCFSKFNLQKKL